jgi:hypothetical protein
VAIPYRDKWVDEVKPEEIRTMLESTFAFLVQDYSFQPPKDLSISTIVISLSYCGRKIAIEPSVDRKDQFVETYIIQLKDGARPQGWKLDDSGHQFMTRLFEAVWDRGVKRHERKTAPASPREYLQSLLDDEAELLRQAFPDFLADDDGYFSELDLRNAKKASARAEKLFFSKAEELFQAHAFRALVSHLSSSKYEISKVWDARLKYAKKKLEKQEP